MEFAMSRIDILRFISDEFFGAGSSDHTVRVTVTMPLNGSGDEDSSTSIDPIH